MLSFASLLCEVRIESLNRYPVGVSSAFLYDAVETELRAEAKCHPKVSSG